MPSDVTAPHGPTCEHCGSALEAGRITCPSCGEARSLGAAAPPPPPPPPPAPVDDEEEQSGPEIDLSVSIFEDQPRRRKLKAATRSQTELLVGAFLALLLVVLVAGAGLWALSQTGGGS